MDWPVQKCSHSISCTSSYYYISVLTCFTVIKETIVCENDERVIHFKHWLRSMILTLAGCSQYFHLTWVGLQSFYTDHLCWRSTDDKSHSYENIGADSPRNCKTVDKAEFKFGERLSCDKSHPPNSCAFHHAAWIKCGKMRHIKSVLRPFLKSEQVRSNYVIRILSSWRILIIMYYPY